jgi:hypothetical protein
VASGPKDVRERNKLRDYTRWRITGLICQKALLHARTRIDPRAAWMDMTPDAIMKFYQLSEGLLFRV